MKIEDLSPENKKQLDNLITSMGQQEDLHPDLQPYRRPGPVGEMIHHPLVINIIHTDQQNAMTNKRYEAKKQAVERAAAEGNWSQFIFLHERPYRLEALHSAIIAGIEEAPTQYWELVASVWTDSENIHEAYDEWVDVWTSAIPNREAAMDEAERAVFNAMPETVRVWRGIGHEEYADGMSWTVDKNKAEWFANRFSGHGREAHIATGTVRKRDILAYFAGRNESEVVVLPEDVQNMEVVKL